MKAYTDYPFVDGDYSIKEIEVLAYDRDKYASVRTPDGTIDQVKTGYITKDAGATKFFNRRVWHSLPTCVSGLKPTRKEVAAERKRWYKKKVTYCVFRTNEHRHRTFTNLKAALEFVKTAGIGGSELVRYSDRKNSWTSDCLIRYDEGVLYRCRRTCGKNQDRCAIKYNRIKLFP